MAVNCQSRGGETLEQQKRDREQAEKLKREAAKVIRDRQELYRLPPWHCCEGQQAPHPLRRLSGSNGG